MLMSQFEFAMKAANMLTVYPVENLDAGLFLHVDVKAVNPNLRTYSIGLSGMHLLDPH
jgi:hypothetical protein